MAPAEPPPEVGELRQADRGEQDVRRRSCRHARREWGVGVGQRGPDRGDRRGDLAGVSFPRRRSRSSSEPASASSRTSTSRVLRVDGTFAQRIRLG